MPELPARMLARYTLIDYDREMALVAVHKERHANADGGFTETERIIGVSRYITNPDQTSCEFSLVVSDDFKGQGLGSRLMLSIIDAARAKGLAEIDGLILANNANMLRLMRSLGFSIGAVPRRPGLQAGEQGAVRPARAACAACTCTPASRTTRPRRARCGSS
jgi:acetyltransferase